MQKKNQKQTHKKSISGVLKERMKKKLEYSLYDNDIRIHDLSQKDRQQKKDWNWNKINETFGGFYIMIA